MRKANPAVYNKIASVVIEDNLNRPGSNSIIGVVCAKAGKPEMVLILTSDAMQIEEGTK